MNFKNVNVEGFRVPTGQHTAAGQEEFDHEALRTKLQVAWRFTQTYKQYQNAPVAIREAHCLSEQYPATCQTVRDHDLIAGRLLYMPLVGFQLENVVNSDIEVLQTDRRPESALTTEEKQVRDTLATAQSGYLSDYSSLRQLLTLTDDEAEQRAIQEMMDFWMEEASAQKYMQALPQDIKDGFGRVTMECQYASTFFRVCCTSVDYDKLLQHGIPGMRTLIGSKKEAAALNGDSTDLYEGMLLGLDVLVNVCDFYRKHCLDLFEEATDAARKRELQKMAAALDAVTKRKPETLREAMQLFWAYDMIIDTVNYGRMDIYFGDFYARDLYNGTETEASAFELIMSLWRLISEQADDGFGSYRFNARIIVGGKGRRNEANADRFAVAALEATRQLKRCEPTTTLRFYKGQNPELMDKAMECLKEGCVHPTLYNDERHIPMTQQAFDVTSEEAEQYLPQGCGEMTVDHISIGSPNNIINFVSALDLVLHDGFSTETQEVRGLQQGGLETFNTFEKLVGAFKAQVDYTNGLFARRHMVEYQVARESAAYLFISMLTDDCIERNKACFDGGVRYLGATIETFGLTNVCDSLIAIKDLVYDKKLLTLEQIVAACDANFQGYEKIQKMLLGAPKYGNDLDVIDTFHKELSAWVCTNANKKAKPAGLHYLLNCNLNPDGIRYAVNTKASPDGRVYGEAFAVGCAPTAGRDQNGITAVLNSMSKHDELHSGYVHNLKVGHSLFAPENIAAFRALIDTYFEKGGWQLMVTVLNPDDLKNAMKDPKNYSHIMVRVGGWTARFVDLPPEHQTDILHRTLYC
ncbi:pyruvate formate lyase family protein [Pontiella sulfatireligans]|uniref:Choline trimethylamine-lyase n=1 Tax=Pontiella sulfatireligans TaxID=2750658 RepID=A0A6C2UI94_9BACT|nr:pyruvate formate lyase family protein [Pontiella sulfatireligans]VGO19593.1 Choline trimethylamine-lyase [Pontiella sulfatireligans]